MLSWVCKVLGLAEFIVVRAIFEAMHKFGFYPELMLDSWLLDASTPALRSNALRIIAAVFAVSFLFLENWLPCILEQFAPGTAQRMNGLIQSTAKNRI